MVKWYNDLYLDEKAKKNIKKIKRTIEKEKTLPDVYLICFPMNSSNLFDIIRASDVLYPYYKKAEVTVIGVAYGKNEAIRIIEKMALEVYQNTDDFDVRGYFREVAD